MIQTINMATIQEALLEALKESPEIKRFCMDKYGRELLTLGLYNPRKPITVEECPVVVLIPHSKEEGDDLEVYRYQLGAALQISPSTQEDAVKELHELSGLVYYALSHAREGRPLSEFSAEFNHIDHQPLHAAYLDITYEISPSIGGTLEF